MRTCYVKNCKNKTYLFRSPAIHKQCIANQQELLRKRRMTWFNNVNVHKHVDESKLDEYGGAFVLFCK